MSRHRASGRLLLLSLLAALLLSLAPMPDWLQPLRPFWLALVLCYWLLEAPELVGLGVAFATGLLADLVFGSLIGEHAMRLVIFAFIILRFRARLRFFPLTQQAVAVLILLLNDRVVSLMIRGVTGEAWPPVSFWIAPLVGALLWPWLFLLLDDLRLKLRGAGG
ncbi:MAG: rod shape-determining protein MreD [Xanthomonadales bacterium]|nr:rod shape-determining protein MreD [Xanthomonadales bacterium]